MEILRIVAIMLVFFLDLTSCKRDDKPCVGQQYYYYISEPDKAKIPYSGTDTLMFVSSAHDTAICVGSGKKQFFRQQLQPNYTKNNCTSPSSDNYEAYSYKFVDLKRQLIIEVVTWKNDGYNSDVVEIFVNDQRFYPLNMSFLTENYYNDSVVTNKRILPSIALKYSTDFIFQYNLTVGFIQFSLSDNTWTLLE